MDKRKEEIISKIAEIMEVGTVGKPRMQACADLLDEYVESKIIERDMFLNRMVVVSYVTIDPDYYTQPQINELVDATKKNMEAVFNPEHAACIVVASPTVRTKVEVINPKMLDEEQLQSLVELIKDQSEEE